MQEWIMHLSPCVSVLKLIAGIAAGYCTEKKREPKRVLRNSALYGAPFWCHPLQENRFQKHDYEERKTTLTYKRERIFKITLQESHFCSLFSQSVLLFMRYMWSPHHAHQVVPLSDCYIWDASDSTFIQVQIDIGFSNVGKYMTCP